GALVAERPHVQLQRLEFHALLVRYVGDVDHAEVRLAGLGAQAGEVRHADAQGVIPLGLRVGAGFQISARLSGHDFPRVRVAGIMRAAFYTLRRGSWSARAGAAKVDVR